MYIGLDCDGAVEKKDCLWATQSEGLSVEVDKDQGKGTGM